MDEITFCLFQSKFTDVENCYLSGQGTMYQGCIWVVLYQDLVKLCTKGFHYRAKLFETIELHLLTSTPRCG